MRGGRELLADLGDLRRQLIVGLERLAHAASVDVLCMNIVGGHGPLKETETPAGMESRRCRLSAGTLARSTRAKHRTASPFAGCAEGARCRHSTTLSPSDLRVSAAADSKRSRLWLLERRYSVPGLTPIFGACFRRPEISNSI